MIAIVGKAEGVVELAVGEQAAIRGDPSTMELELDPAVERGLRGRALWLHPSHPPCRTCLTTSMSLTRLAE